MSRRLFAKRPFQLTRVFILVIISAITLICDRNLQFFPKIRSVFITVIEDPLQRAANIPSILFTNVYCYFVSKHSYFVENNYLQAELAKAKIELQKLEMLEHENEELSKLLHLSLQPKTKFLPAQLLNSVTINKGSEHNIYLGQPIVDAYGLLGQVILISHKISKILLITDPKSAIPVSVLRNGLQLIAIGTGDSNVLELLNIPETMDIKENDVLVTSNIGQRFPAGLSVGTVKTIKHIAGARFMQIIITPSAHIGSNKNILLVTNK